VCLHCGGGVVRVEGGEFVIPLHHSPEFSQAVEKCSHHLPALNGEEGFRIAGDDIVARGEDRAGVRAETGVC